MEPYLKKSRFFLFLALFLGLFLFLPKEVSAISNAKDTISTSRPSAYSTLGVGVSVNDALAVVVDNGSRWIASDSATIIGVTTYSVTVASMSATAIPATGQRTLYFTAGATGIGNSASVIYTPITAKHTVSFMNEAAIPSNGKIQVIFPVGVGNTGNLPASDSFSFNNIQGNNISISGGGVGCSSWTITESTKTFQCNLNAGVTGPATISINIGSTTPTLINPYKTTTAGTADTWTVQIKTLNSSSTVIEETKTKIATVESVEVYATVEPTLTFTIAGMGNGVGVSAGNAIGCLMTESINTGHTSTATEVNLGVLTSAQINISAQLMTVTTNGFGGYSLTATASGHLIDNALGYWIADVATTTDNDTPAVGTAMAAGTPAYGIHACGADVNTTNYGTNNCGTAAGTCKYKMPTISYYHTVASDTTGPIAGTAGNGLTTVTYASTVSSAVPAGSYHTTMTYVATPTF